MLDQFHQESNEERLNEIAKSYFAMRLRGIGHDVRTVQTAYRQGKLTRHEFLLILRSLAHAKGEIQTEVDRIAGNPDPCNTKSHSSEDST